MTITTNDNKLFNNNILTKNMLLNNKTITSLLQSQNYITYINDCLENNLFTHGINNIQSAMRFDGIDVNRISKNEDYEGITNIELSYNDRLYIAHIRNVSNTLILIDEC